MTKNLGKIAHSDTKMPILCSKSPKWGFGRAKAHKNADFVLGGFPDGGFDSFF